MSGATSDRPLADNGRLLRAVAARIVGEADADDVVQETFLRALVSPPPELTPAETASTPRSTQGRTASRSIQPWLVAVARHVAIDWLRKHGRVVPTDVASLDTLPATAQLEVPGADLPRLLAGLGRLSEGEVVVLLLRDALDLTVAEVADALDTSVGAVRVLHHRARRKAAEAHGAPDAGGLVALDRFLTWLMAREVAGVPVRARRGEGPDPAFAAGVLDAQFALLDAMVRLAGDAGRPELEARARLSRGIVRRVNAPEAALDDLERALALGGDASIAGRHRAWILLQLGRRAEARDAAEAALAATTAPAARANLHQLLAYLCQGDHPDEAAQHVAAAAEAGGGPASSLAAGLAHLFAGRPEQARVELLVFLAGARERGSPPDEIVALINLGSATMDLDDGDAERCFAHALALTRRYGDRMRETTAVGNLACIERLRGNYPAARAGFLRAIALAQETGRAAFVELYRMNLAIQSHIEGDLAGAEAELDAVVRRQYALDMRWDGVASKVWLTAVRIELGSARADAFDEVLAEADAANQPMGPIVAVLRALDGLDTDAGRDHARAQLAEVAADRRSGVRNARAIVAAALVRAGDPAGG